MDIGNANCPDCGKPMTPIICECKYCDIRMEGKFSVSILAKLSPDDQALVIAFLRSYGSMTYAGLKSMLYAGLGPEDPRVKAAYEGIRRYYTTAENPGLNDAGLYYYYHVFAKALDAIGEPEIVDADNITHDWQAMETF